MKRFLLLLILLTAGLARADALTDSLALDAELQGLDARARLEFLQARIEGTLRDDPRNGRRLARRALSLAEELGDDRARYQAYMNLGVAHYFQGQYQNALRFYEEAQKLAVALGDRLLQADVINNIGVLYFVWGEHDQALEYYLQVLKIDLELGEKVGTAKAYNNIAAVHQTAGRFQSALEFYHEALALYRQQGDQTYVASTLNNIGLIQYDQQNYAEATDALEQALRIEREIGDRSGESLSLNNLGKVRVAQGRLDEAGRLYAAALEIRRAVGDRQGEAVTLQQMGGALVLAGQTETGIAMLEQALEICRELEVQELIRDCLADLSAAWEEAGRFDKALEYARLHKEAHDKLFDEQSNRRMAAAEARFELDLKDQEIDGLRREAEYEAFRRNIMLMAAGLLLIIILLLWNRYRFQKRANKEIQAKNAALSQAHADLEKAARTELAHVARVATMGELTAAFAHELNQPLAAIKANVRAARNLRGLDEEMPDEVDEALQDIRDDAERAREIIQRLRAMMRKGEERREPCDLNEVIEAVVKIVEPAANSQNTTLVLELASAPPTISGDRIQLQQVLLNLVQNAIAAMAPQGGAIRIVSETTEDGGVAVRVIDQGPVVETSVLADMFTPFFTTKSEGLGMGLPICRTIIEAHEGQLVTQRNDDHGLTMIVRLPASQ